MQAARGTAIAAQAKRLVAIWLPIALLGYLIDLASKQAAVAWLDPTDPPVLFGGLLRLQLVRNPGAAFSLGEGFTVALSIFAIVALPGVLVYGAPRLRTRAQAVALGLLVAGITGNLTDRIFRDPGPLEGHVVDMFQLPYFAIFNVADICITSAAVLIVILSFLGDKAGKAETNDGADVEAEQAP